MIPSITGLPDPREGEWPEPAEWCFEHEQRKDSCGQCEMAAIYEHLAERELAPTEQEDALRVAFRAALDRINARGK